MPSFRQAQKDPVLLLSQIICLQAAFYTFNSVAVLCAEAYTNADISLDHILDPSEFRGDTVLGWSLSLCWLLSSGFGSLLLVRIVGRVRLCLDFSATLHLIHLVLSTLHTHHVPSSMFWWILNIISCAIMTISGEWLCMRYDLEPILLGGSRSNNPVEDGNDETSSPGSLNPQDGGRSSKGRDKRKKSGVSYEMLPLAEIDRPSSSHNDITEASSSTSFRPLSAQRP